MVRGVQIVLLLVLVEFATALVFNDTLDPLDNDINVIKTRRSGKKKKSKSTSSSKERSGDGGADAATGSSLQEAFSEESSTDTDEKGRPKKKEHKRKSSEERKGWRKWHRKCTQCPIEMRQRWRDPSIKWICGAYQQARRSFKSLCMMHLRNCQDGTMFTKIADHRCPNASGIIRPHGEHFFYDYKVVLSQDSSESTAEESEKTETEEDESSSWSSSRIRTIPPEPPKAAFQAF